MRVLVALSGGVDSSVAAALLVEDGHEVVGATMKLWGGAGDSGCCSVADVDDARRVAQQLGIPHHVFNFADDFERHVVTPYTADHAAGRTPNPCIECNRHLKFDRFLRRARQLGFDCIATGHHARVVPVSAPGGPAYELRRGADPAKDQSYVLSMLGRDELARTRFPVGHLTKAEVRARAAALGLRTAAKPDSQDVCFITSGAGRAGFLGGRIPLRPGALVDAATGREVGRVDAVEMVTVGQRRGMGVSGTGDPRYALEVDVDAGRVVVGSRHDLLAATVVLAGLTWVGTPVDAGTAVMVQSSAHGRPAAATFEGTHVTFAEPQRRVAPGQTVALYDLDADRVLGAGIAARR